MISIKHNFIFIHVPKTAGNSFQNILKNYSEDKIVSPLNWNRFMKERESILLCLIIRNESSQTFLIMRINLLVLETLGIE